MTFPVRDVFLRFNVKVLTDRRTVAHRRCGANHIVGLRDVSSRLQVSLDESSIDMKSYVLTMQGDSWDGATH